MCSEDLIGCLIDDDLRRRGGLADSVVGIPAADVVVAHNDVTAVAVGFVLEHADAVQRWDCEHGCGDAIVVHWGTRVRARLTDRHKFCFFQKCREPQTRSMTSRPCTVGSWRRVPPTRVRSRSPPAASEFWFSVVKCLMRAALTTAGRSDERRADAQSSSPTARAVGTTARRAPT